MRVQDKEVTFNVFNAMKHPMKSESCFRVDIVEAIMSIKKGHIDSLETSLVYGVSPNIVDEETKGLCDMDGLVRGEQEKLF